MILIPLCIFAIILYQFKIKGVFTALLFIVATKSIIDVFWNFKIGSLSIMSLQGFMITFMFIPMLFDKKQISKKWVVLANYYLLALTFSILLSLFVDPGYFFQFFFLSINAYLGFFIIPVLVNDREKLRKLLIAIMISGIFPAVVCIYQYITGATFGGAELRKTVGLTRFVGLYHDAFPTRFYGLITLFSILMFANHFKFKNKLYALSMYSLAFLAVFSVYLVFSKAGVTILLVWGLIILIYSKNKIKNSLIFSLLFLVLLMVLGDKLVESTIQLFSKETGYNNGDVDDIKYTLAGRGYIWAEAWDLWLNRNLFFQFLGDGISRPVHNEFFRIFLMNGFFGFLFLLTFLFRISSQILQAQKKIKMFGLMLLSMYLIDATGLTPGVYYYYNIFVWGMLGIIIMRPNLFNKNTLKHNKYIKR